MGHEVSLHEIRKRVRRDKTVIGEIVRNVASGLLENGVESIHLNDLSTLIGQQILMRIGTANDGELN